MPATSRSSREPAGASRRDRDPSATAAQKKRAGPRDRRARQADLEVASLPPVWKRSLTESGNPTKVTRGDVIAVALFFIALLAAVIFVAAGGAADLLNPGTG